MSGASRSTRAMASAAQVSGCDSHSVMARADIDTRKVLRGTEYDAPVMKSKMAIQRGIIFEGRLEANGYSNLLSLIAEETGASVVTVHNMDQVAGDDSAKAARTLRIIQDALDSNEAVLIREARIPSPLGSTLKSDYLLVGPDSGNRAEPGKHLVTVIEAKSWPVLDGRPVSPSLFGKAIDQASIYVVLLRDALGDPSLVSGDVLMLNPKNVGYEPIITRYSTGDRIRKAQDTIDIALASMGGGHEGPLDDDLNVQGMDDEEHADPEVRLERARQLIEHHGNSFDPVICNTSCGLVNLCHELAYRNGDLSVIGSHVKEAIPGVTSLDRVAELAAGAEPTPEEGESTADIRLASQRIDRVLGRSR